MAHETITSIHVGDIFMVFLPLMVVGDEVLAGQAEAVSPRFQSPAQDKCVYLVADHVEFLRIDQQRVVYRVCIQLEAVEDVFQIGFLVLAESEDAKGNSRIFMPEFGDEEVFFSL